MKFRITPKHLFLVLFVSGSVFAGAPVPTGDGGVSCNPPCTYVECNGSGCVACNAHGCTGFQNAQFGDGGGL